MGLFPILDIFLSREIDNADYIWYAMVAYIFI